MFHIKWSQSWDGHLELFRELRFQRGARGITLSFDTVVSYDATCGRVAPP